MANFKEEIARIRAFVFDVDGVFTDGRIVVTPEGEFLRAYNSKDGYAVSFAIRQGYKVCIITGGRGKTLDMRFRMLNVSSLYTACLDKAVCLQEFLEEHSLSPDEAIFMGDDLPDVEAMQRCGLAACPADAAPEVIAVSHYVSPFAGGEGCVRDIIEQTLRARNDWFIEKGFNVVPSA
ncbi:MAG: HAD-IIIA family hydrolase [Rikenellaceae bacterium]|jgi:3-deoxy-D-manno-octulosonate 8-phosphate phosphatase (KDO 8-P phosphatase)|nr:HAD-IIIA family hydrolase [Rikenellaceae bacterium]